MIKFSLGVNKCPLDKNASAVLYFHSGEVRVYYMGQCKLPCMKRLTDIQDLNWLNVKEYEVIKDNFTMIFDHKVLIK